MKFLTWGVVSLMGMAMLVSLHQIISAGMAAHGWDGLKAADWAAWVQAIGSIAAIGGAVWISKREQLERRDNAAADAILTGAVYLLPLREIHHRLRIMIGRLDTVPIIEPSPDEWTSMLRDLQHHSRIPANDLLKFSALGNKCALSLARADADLSSCEKLLTLIIAGQTATSSYESRTNQIALLSKIADRALDNVEHSLIVISNAVEPDRVG